MYYAARTAFLVADYRMNAEREAAARRRRMRDDDDEVTDPQKVARDSRLSAIRRLFRRGRTADALA
jgi:hypothetical protein